MKNQNRKLKYDIRLTEAEAELFKRKAERYSSLAAMLRTAVSQLDDRASKKKIDILDESLAHYCNSKRFYLGTFQAILIKS